MCELLAIRSKKKKDLFALREVFDLAVVMEKYGIAGFGWGIAWLDDDQEAVRVYRRELPLREDEEGRTALGMVRTRVALLHLRRPSCLSTIGLADTQPFLSTRYGFAFTHNGGFHKHAEHRPHYEEQHRLEGKADSEIGFLLLEDYLQDMTPEEALPQIHEDLGGTGNMIVLMGDGMLAGYAGEEENPLFGFEQQGRRYLATSLYSRDSAVFSLVFKQAEEVKAIPVGHVLLESGCC